MVTAHINLAFRSAGSEIARDENVAVAAEIPVGVGFAANAGAPGFVFSCFGRGRFALAQTFSRSPADCLKNQSRDDGHRVSAEKSNVAAVSKKIPWLP
jgi:hypothetical protein